MKLRTPINRLRLLSALSGVLRFVKRNGFRQLLIPTLVLSAGALGGSTGRSQDAPPATLTTIHRFSGTDGSLPYGGLALGRDGNFYGTTYSGVPSFVDANSPNAGGTLYKITPAGALTTLHSDPYDAGTGLSANDAGAQYHSELIQGSDGDFYGVSTRGGHYGDGAVFKISATGAYTTLHSFQRAVDGLSPYGALVQASDGNFYGTTEFQGGTDAASIGGTVFKITPDGVLTTLHHFSGQDDSMALYPTGKLLQASDGNFYGTTSGLAGNGSSVFKMTPAGEFTVLHTFALQDDGTALFAGLVEGPDGNFYGTASDAGASNYFGTVFRITPAGAVTILHRFGSADDGEYPVANLIVGQDGKLYGTTFSRAYYGTVFSIKPDGTEYQRLYTFAHGADGGQPNGVLVQAADGSFYGTTDYGGTGDQGTIFRLVVNTHPPFFNGEAALGNGVYYLSFPSGNAFGYYSYLTDPAYIYHFDLGYEYVFDAADVGNGVYLYDFKSNGFFYTSPVFPFPYLYDFSLNSVVYYYPDARNPGHYNTNGYRFFYVFNTGQIISK